MHCQKGISRSASVVIAFVKEEMNLDYEKALEFVRRNRPQAKPNAGFAKQLELWGVLGYNIYDEAGKDKPEYAAWKQMNEEDFRRHGRAWEG